MIRKLRLEQTFTVVTALLLLALLGTAFAGAHAWVRGALRRGLEGRALSVARSIGAVAEPALLSYNHVALQAAADSAMGDPDLCHVAIYDKEGRVAGSAGDAPAAAAEVPQGFEPQVFEREHSTVEGGSGEPVLEVLVPVRIAGVDRPWGAVRLGFRDGTAAELRRLELFLGLVGVALIFVAALGARVVARVVTAPLRRLAAATEALARGDASRRLPVTGTRETVELTESFNALMERLQSKAAESSAYQEQLARLNATLERQVVERTRALEASVERYRTLVEQSPEPILIVQNGRLRFANPSFERVFGTTSPPPGSVGCRLETLFEEQSARTVEARVAAWQQGTALGPAEVLARGANGELRHMELRGSRIEHEGQPAAECLLVDRTEERRLREKLEDSGRLRALGELAGGVAHDFNNLLGAILGRVQLLRGRELPRELDRELGVVEQAAKDGRETVLRIQEFSGTRADRVFSAVSLPAILEDAIEMTRPRWRDEADKRGASIRLVTHYERVPPVLGNAAELREVFINLLLNAVDAMPDGGELRLVSESADGRVIARVEDTGVGMSEETRRRLFDPFFTTKGLGGTGLGMSVAYGIVTRHGGEIDVASDPGHGSRFTVGLPIATAVEPRPGAQTSPKPSLPRRAARVLVIDDEAPVAELLSDALRIAGHSVDVAHGGQAGIALATSTGYDVVLTDLGMPDMSGWEVTSRIRVLQPHVPVVLVTGWGASITEQEIASAGLAAVVHKPFEIRPLLATIAEVLGSAERSAENAPGAPSVALRSL